MAYEAALRRLVRARMVPMVQAFLRASLERAQRDEEREDATDPFEDLDWAGLRKRLERVATNSGALIDGFAVRVSEANRRDVARVLRLDIAKQPAAIKRLLERWRRANVELITSVARDMHSDVYRVVREAARKGTRVETLSKQIAERYDVSASRAARIARDQTLKANADLTRTRFAEAGVTKYAWSTSRDEKVRPMHKALEGLIFDFAHPPITNEAGERNNPGEDIECRCVAIAVLG